MDFARAKGKYNTASLFLGPKVYLRHGISGSNERSGMLGGKKTKTVLSQGADKTKIMNQFFPKHTPKGENDAPPPQPAVNQGPVQRVNGEAGMLVAANPSPPAPWEENKQFKATNTSSQDGAITKRCNLLNMYLAILLENPPKCASLLTYSR